MTAILDVISPQQINLSGQLNFYTVTPLCAQAKACAPATGPVTVSLRGVTEADSAALLVILTLLRTIEKQEQTILFTHLPASILALIQLYDLEKVIPYQKNN